MGWRKLKGLCFVWQHRSRGMVCKYATTQFNNNFKRDIDNNKMDPRPIHFEYRRPRHYNPTYQSSHCYQSIFTHKDGPKMAGKAKPRNPEQVSQSFSEQPASMKRVNSTDITSKKHVELQGLGRYESKGEGRGAGRSKMASYGNNLMRNSSMEQTQVYKKQEKEFNIINFYPKDYKPTLKAYPKLSLEHRLIENGKKQPA